MLLIVIVFSRGCVEIRSDAIVARWLLIIGWIIFR
jgi:hypothetical protein